MALAVALEVVFSGEGLVAQRALKGPRPAVQGQVVFQVVRVEEPGGAVGTRVRALTRVFPHVDLQLIVARKKIKKRRDEIRKRILE